MPFPATGTGEAARGGTDRGIRGYDLLAKTPRECGPPRLPAGGSTTRVAHSRTVETFAGVTFALFTFTDPDRVALELIYVGGPS